MGVPRGRCVHLIPPDAFHRCTNPSLTSVMTQHNASRARCGSYHDEVCTWALLPESVSVDSYNLCASLLQIKRGRVPPKVHGVVHCCLQLLHVFSNARVARSRASWGKK